MIVSGGIYQVVLKLILVILLKIEVEWWLSFCRFWGAFDLRHGVLDHTQRFVIGFRYHYKAITVDIEVSEPFHSHDNFNGTEVFVFDLLLWKAKGLNLLIGAHFQRRGILILTIRSDALDLRRLLPTVLKVHGLNSHTVIWHSLVLDLLWVWGVPWMSEPSVLLCSTTSHDLICVCLHSLKLISDQCYLILDN